MKRASFSLSFCAAFRRVLFAVCAAALLGPAFCAAPALAQGARAQQYHPGLRTLGIWDPVLGLRLDAAVWYPSLRASREVRLDGWTITASRNGREVAGRYPLILISHGAASNRLALHDLAEALARRGFVVAAPTHPHDNMDDTSDIYRASLLQDRPLHLLLTLETLLAHPELSAIIDESRIGLLGVGSGSATVLQLLGARPDVTKLPAYCAEDPGIDPYCTPWAKAQYPQLEKEAALLLSQLGTDVLTPRLDALSKPAPLEPPRQNAPPPAPAEAASKETGEENPEAMPSPLPSPVRVVPAKTSRRPAATRAVKAAALLTPGLAALFQGQDLRSLPVAMAIVSVENDELYPPSSNAARLRGQFPPGTQWLSIPGASHYSVQSMCPQSLIESFPAMCGRNTPKDNAARQARTAFLTDFFQKALGAPLPPLAEAETTPPKQSGRKTVQPQANATKNATLAPAANATQSAAPKANATKRSGPRRNQR